MQRIGGADTMPSMRRSRAESAACEWRQWSVWGVRALAALAALGVGCAPDDDAPSGTASAGRPDKIDCPERAEAEFIRFDETRMGFNPDVLSEVGWRCVLPSGERHGPSKEWFRNGRVSAITNWWEGDKHGPFEMWHSNGQKRAEGAHDHWNAVGVWRTWDTEGNLISERDFGSAEKSESKDPVKSPAAGPPTEAKPATGSKPSGTPEALTEPDSPADSDSPSPAGAKANAQETPRE